MVLSRWTSLLRRAEVLRKPVLNRREWLALGSLVSGIETLERVAVGAGVGPGFSCDDFLHLIFRLYWRDFLTLRQCPSAEQTFADRRIVPANPNEIAGDLEAVYREEFRAWEQAGPRSGRPLGVYAELTQAGFAEWSKPVYSRLYATGR